MGSEEVGTWKQFFHGRPCTALSTILIVTFTTVWCHVVWFIPRGGILPMASLVSFIFCVSQILYNYFSASLKGPGFVPLKWRPTDPEDERYLKFCETCEGYKPPRSHHCRNCGRCVLKMDHHCPWINTCCGHLNHANFCLFVFYAPVGCFHALCILIPSLYVALNFHHVYPNEPVSYVGVLGTSVNILAVILAFGVTFLVGMLLYKQINVVLNNETNLESMLIEKILIARNIEGGDGDFVYPYNLGWKKNVKQVFTWTGRPKSNGYHWDIVKEQINQKLDKGERTFEFTVLERYTGSMFPLSKGYRIACSVPCTDDLLLPVDVGDKVIVSRLNKHWLYGYKVNVDTLNGNVSSTERINGWFPRRCAQLNTAVKVNEKKKS